MNVNRVLQLDNTDPVSRLQDFLLRWWKQVGLKAMLAPVTLPDQSGVVPKIIEDPADLAAVNPFAPMMLSNAASAACAFIRDQPHGPLAVMLRPCELRTLVELQKRKRVFFHSLQPGNGQNYVVLIGVDCPGTFSTDEFVQRIERSGIDGITLEALAYGAEGNPLPRQLRIACQVCDWPAPWNADLTIGTIGVAPHQYMLLIARDELIDSCLALEETTDRIAEESEVIRRETALSSVINAHAARRDSLDAPVARRLGDLCGLLACFARCTLCTDCLDACPLYGGELSGLLGVSGIPQRTRPALTEMVAVSRWLASCSGCGMCEDACQQGVPLARLISILSHNIRDELHYTAGKPEQRLPWEAL
jgi:formate dehydrogenase subunit beta